MARTRQATKTAESKATTRRTATPKATDAKAKETEDLTAKLQAQLEAAQPTDGEQPKQVEAPSEEPKAAEETPAVEAKVEAPKEEPKPKKRAMLPGQVGDDAPPLKEGEYQVEIPRPDGPIQKRFMKPADGKWVVSASERNARMWHVIDLDRVDEGRTLCTLVFTKWMGGARRDFQPDEQPITCPWCLLRAKHAGMTTDEAQAEAAEKAMERAKAARKKDEPAPAAAASEDTATGQTPDATPETPAEPTPDAPTEEVAA